MREFDIGVLVRLEVEPERTIRKVVDLGLRNCQVSSWEPAHWTAPTGRGLMEAARAAGVMITGFWAGYSGPRVWNFTEGPTTIGLVPPAHRPRRTAELIQAAEFAASLGLPSIATHVGFLPEDPNDSELAGTVESLKLIAGRCRELGIGFNFETGQETPVALLRAIELIDLPNVGVNLDPANLILYGKANPVDALDVIGRYVRGVHAKDGLSHNSRELGKQVPLGEGKVDFPALIAGLKNCGYEGALTIEREISGPRQIADVKKAIEFLRAIV